MRRSGPSSPPKGAASAVRDPDVLRELQHDVHTRASTLHSWLAESAAAGRTVLGYGAASRAVALLNKAQVDSDLLPAIADASPGKRGLRMPGTTIRVISPTELNGAAPGRGSAVRLRSDGRGSRRLPGNRGWGRPRPVNADAIGSSPARS